MKKILLFFTFVVFSYALELNSITSVMQQNIDKSLQLLQSQKDKNKIADEIFEIFSNCVDFDLMAKLSLSKNFNLLNEQEQSAFTKAFKTSLKKSLANKLALYKQEKITIKNASFKNKRYIVNAVISNSKEDKNINFKFYEKSKDDYMLYDIDILGVSLVQTYRSEFGDILKTQGFDVLLKKLEQININ